ncbi:hypothetical protein HNQ36_004412 [Afipia massiliensis]|uniref:Uncharacterized protein n=1 Tax=Afipia massiliensis TaxID=211460 RepID=A0A840N5F3_9BRAD|nr:hypothetical protein [Afipia massiliensis]
MTVAGNDRKLASWCEELGVLFVMAFLRAGGLG